MNNRSVTLGADKLVIAIPADTISFNPNADGLYDIVLVAYDAQGLEVGRAQIEVVVGAVPEPASMAIWGLGALGCAVAGYRRRKQAV